VTTPPEQQPEQLSHWSLAELLGPGYRRLRRRASPREALARGVRRVEQSAWQIGQCAVAAVVAWLIASHVVQHGTPVFAPIAALVCLGLSHAARIRRVAELAAGVSIGVGLADVLTRIIGSGWWQIGLITAIAMSVAQLLGGGVLITNQAAVQAIFLVALPQPAGGGLARWEDAIIGSLTALVVAAVLPPDPVRAVRPQARLLIIELADVVEAAARAVRAGDAALADSTLERARGTQVNVQRLTDALRGGQEITRISPLRRHRREELERYRRTLIGVDRAARNLRVAMRRTATVLDRGRPLPMGFADMYEALGRILRNLHDQVGTSEVDLPLATRSQADPPDPSSVPGALIRLAGLLDPVRMDATSMSATVIVAQVRSAVVDLLEITGMGLDEARRLLPHSTGPLPPVD